jgi:hypothetical protein
MNRRVMVLLAGLVLIASSSLGGQSVDVTAEVGALVEGHLSVGLRLDAGFRTVGVYARGARRAHGEECQLSIPAICRYPTSASVWDYAGGVIVRRDVGRALVVTGSGGGGVVSWGSPSRRMYSIEVEDRVVFRSADWLMEADLAAHIRVWRRAELLVALRAEQIFLAERVGHPPYDRVPARRVPVAGVRAGIRVPLLSR